MKSLFSILLFSLVLFSCKKDQHFDQLSNDDVDEVNRLFPTHRSSVRSYGNYIEFTNKTWYWDNVTDSVIDFKPRQDHWYKFNFDFFMGVTLDQYDTANTGDFIKPNVLSKMYRKNNYYIFEGKLRRDEYYNEPLPINSFGPDSLIHYGTDVHPLCKSTFVRAINTIPLDTTKTKEYVEDRYQFQVNGSTYVLDTMWLEEVYVDFLDSTITDTSVRRSNSDLYIFIVKGNWNGNTFYLDLDSTKIEQKHTLLSFYNYLYPFNCFKFMWLTYRTPDIVASNYYDPTGYFPTMRIGELSDFGAIKNVGVWFVPQYVPEYTIGTSRFTNDIYDLFEISMDRIFLNKTQQRSIRTTWVTKQRFRKI